MLVWHRHSCLCGKLVAQPPSAARVAPPPSAVFLKNCGAQAPSPAASVSRSRAIPAIPAIGRFAATPLHPKIYRSYAIPPNPCSCGTAALGGVLEELWSAGALACGIGFPITRDSGDSGDPGDLAAPPPFLKLLLKTKA